MYKKTKTFGKDEVIFSVSCHEVAFTINGTMDCYESQHTVAITRWLLSQLKEAKGYYPYLLCTAYSADGNRNYREGIFRRLGFLNFGKHWVWNPDPWDTKVPELFS